MTRIVSIGFGDDVAPGDFYAFTVPVDSQADRAMLDILGLLEPIASGWRHETITRVVPLDVVSAYPPELVLAVNSHYGRVSSDDEVCSACGAYVRGGSDPSVMSVHDCEGEEA